MRLINIHTLALEEFYDNDIPPYAILSHRWGKDEVSYKDFKKGRNREGAGWRKIEEVCAFVAKLNTLKPLRLDPTKDRPSRFKWCADYVWVDTCCIDKRSSAELSETINSMYKWYGKSQICIAYLGDLRPRITDRKEFLEAFQKSTWFTRGWTLQELLAPSNVLFCSRCWEPIGFKEIHSLYHSGMAEISRLADLGWHGDLSHYISERTTISVECLESRGTMEGASIACKMSWAAHRVTTRVEDTAYCLLGIFGINIPLLYGEGDRAFLRLQEEIVRRSSDQTIFAWRLPGNEVLWTDAMGAFAKAPSYFADCGRIALRSGFRMYPFHLTNIGVEMKARLQLARRESPRLTGGSLTYILRLDQCWEAKLDPVDSIITRPCEIALRVSPGQRTFARVQSWEPSFESLYPLGERGPYEEERVLYLTIDSGLISHHLALKRDPIEEQKRMLDLAIDFDPLSISENNESILENTIFSSTYVRPERSSIGRYI